jgi:hypothetical protein
MRVARKCGNPTQRKSVMCSQVNCLVNGKSHITVTEIAAHIFLPRYTSIFIISKLITSVQFILRKTNDKWVLVLVMNVSWYCFPRDIGSEQNSGRNHTSLSVTTNWSWS